jgi:hypothetical protein
MEMIRRMAVSLPALVLALIAMVSAAPLPSGNSGIASRYPFDAGIASDPAVIFADDFESYTGAAGLTSRWSEAYHSANARIASESINVLRGARSLEFTVPYSFEFMVKANTPGQRDGRVAFWLDGQLIADFPNLRLRETTALKIDRFTLDIHVYSNNLAVRPEVVRQRGGGDVVHRPMVSAPLTPPTGLRVVR